MSSTGLVDIWINCPDRATADAIAEACVERRLAACANILAPIGSIYRWNGAIERAQEVPLILKTRSEHFLAVCEAVKALHPYEVPSIVATGLPLVEPAYAEWLRQETAEPAQSRR